MVSHLNDMHAILYTVITKAMTGTWKRTVIVHVILFVCSRYAYQFTLILKCQILKPEIIVFVPITDR